MQEMKILLALRSELLKDSPDFELFWGMADPTGTLQI
jgi:hypothetical protein